MSKKRKAAVQPLAPVEDHRSPWEDLAEDLPGQGVTVPETLAGTSRQRPVIAGRVSQELYGRIKAAAEASGRSMSEELAWRAEQAIAWEKAHGTIQGLLAEARRITDRNIEAELRKRGFTPVRLLPQGKAWVSPDADKAKLNLAIDVDKLAIEMLPSIKAGLHEALGNLAKKKR